MTGWGVKLRTTVRNGRLRVVIFQEGEWLCAHCLEYDFATQAKSLSDLQSGLERLIAGHIAISLKHGLKPFRNVQQAPARLLGAVPAVEDLPPRPDIRVADQEARHQNPDARDPSRSPRRVNPVSSRITTDGAWRAPLTSRS